MKRQSLATGLVILGIASLLVSALIVVSSYWRVAINVTPSLPDHVYLIDLKDSTPKRDGLIAFKAQGMPPIPDQVTVVKIVRGLPGDVITVIERAVYVNGRFAGYAKPKSQTGESLMPITSQTIPEGKVFVHAPHPDSFDSRYAIPGLIDQAQVIGRARALF